MTNNQYHVIIQRRFEYLPGKIMINAGLHNPELVIMIHSVAKLKSMNTETLYEMLEDILADIVAKQHYGLPNSKTIKLKIDRHTGSTSASIMYNVVDSLSAQVSHDGDTRSTIAIEEAKEKFGENTEVGDVVLQELPYRELTRRDMQLVKDALIEKIAEYERKKQYQLFVNRIGEVVHGIVEKVFKGPKGAVLVRISGGVALLRAANLLPTDHFILGDKVKAIVDSLDENCELSQVILSRTSDEFLIKLFAEYVPQVSEGIVRIPAIARNPGYQSKVAVYTTDTINPIGACVGVRATRLREIMRELNNEKIDLVLWSSDIREFIENALSPIQPKQLIIDKNKNSVIVILDEKDLSAAIGRGGRNVKLLAMLFNMAVEICSTVPSQEDRSSERSMLNTVDRMMSSLDIDYALASLLKKYGYPQIEDIADADPNDFVSDIEDMTLEVAEELIRRANEYLESDKDDNQDEAKYNISSRFSSSNSLRELAEFSNETEVEATTKESLIDLYARLQKALILSRCYSVESIAALSVDELLDIAERYNVALSYVEAEKVVRNARKQTYFRACKQQ